MAELIDIFAPEGPAQADPSLAEQAYAQLRRDIIRGEIAPDEKLKIDTLQRRYSLSNTPLREALNRLAGERLVVADDRRGFRAAPVSLQDFRDLTEYRLVLERGALTAAIEHGRDEWEGEVVGAYRRLEALEARVGGARTHYEEWIARHKAFHMAMLSGCMSQRLLVSCGAVFDEGERYRYLAGRKQTLGGRHSGNEHLQIMEATLDRDVQLATALLRNHVLKTSAHVLEILSAANGSDAKFTAAE